MTENAKLGHSREPRKFPYASLYVKRRVTQIGIDCLVILVKGIENNLGRQKILLRMKDSIRASAAEIGLDRPEVTYLWKCAYGMFLKVQRKTYKELRKAKWQEASSGEKYELIYDSIRAMIQQNTLVHQANQVMYSYEQRAKHREIYGEEGLLAKAKSPFFLSSAHPLPAKEHAAYEGKVYYDADWEQKGDYSDTEKMAIRAYIRNRKIITVQEVVSGPIYLCTRKNCRHTLKNMPLQEVLHGSAKSLLRKHKMYMQKEEPVSREILYYREYYNRAKIEGYLNKMIPNLKLKKDLEKDIKLLDKWKNALYNNGGSIKNV